jgi:hypothetical protein
MNKHDRVKVMNAGFTILRADDTNKPIIKELTCRQTWKTWKEFPTKAARDREVYRITQHQEKLIFD